MSATNNHNYAEKNVNMNPTIFLSIKTLLKEMFVAQYNKYISSVSFLNEKYIKESTY